MCADEHDWEAIELHSGAKAKSVHGNTARGSQGAFQFRFHGYIVPSQVKVLADLSSKLG